VYLGNRACQWGAGCAPMALMVFPGVLGKIAEIFRLTQQQIHQGNIRPRAPQQPGLFQLRGRVDYAEIFAEGGYYCEN
jgi:hypothetical protein